MNNRLEDKIRDYLAANLELLESGLLLLHKEYIIKSPHGAGGKIDIIAKDRFGHFLIIEIKRSDQVARSALNEIHKYVALFRIRQGINENKLRLMVVSTEWHELLLPLSEFAATSQYAVEGIDIKVMPDGVITTVSKVDLVSKTASLKMSRMQGMYFYTTDANRNKHHKSFVDVLNKIGISDFAIFHCNYRGDNPQVIFPFCSYFCFSSPLLTLPEAEHDKIKGKMEWEDDLIDIDENFIAAINGSDVRFYENFEIGYPEKLNDMLYAWSVKMVTRSGRLGGKDSLWSDENIIKMAQGIEGSSPYYFARVSSPRFNTEWSLLCREMDSTLRGNPIWCDLVPKILEEIRCVQPNATVSVALYSPANLFMTLYSIRDASDFSKCPHLEIVIEDGNSQDVRIINGMLVWDGQGMSASIETIMEQVFGDDFGWVMATQMGQTCAYEHEIAKAHHVKEVLSERMFSQKKSDVLNELVIRNGSIVRQPFPETGYLSLVDYAASETEYLTSLKLYIDERVYGLSKSQSSPPTS